MAHFKKQYGGESICAILDGHERFHNTDQSIDVFLSTLTADDFIIVGGGPVGLQTVIEMSSILTKNKQFNRKICIIENRDMNERKQILLIEPVFWNEIPTQIKQYINIKGGLCLPPDKGHMFNCNNSMDINFEELKIQDNLLKGYVRIDILQDAYYTYVMGLANVYICLTIKHTAESILTSIKTTLVKNIILCDGGGPMSISKKIFQPDNFISAKVSNAVVLGFDCEITEQSKQNYEELLQRREYDPELLNQRQLLTYVTKHLNEPNKYSGYIGLQICDKSYNDIKHVNNITKKTYADCPNTYDAQLQRLKDIFLQNYEELLQRREYDPELLNQRQLLTYVTKHLNEPNKYSGYIGLQICDKSYNDIKHVNNITKKTYADCPNTYDAQLQRLKDIFLQKKTENGLCYQESNTTKSSAKTSFPEFALIQYALNLFSTFQMTSAYVFEITLSSAKEFYTRIANQYFYLIGDAAFKTHFFTGTGLNRGFASSKILLQLLLKLEFNNELLATSFNLAQIKMRNTLWKEQIPKFMFDLCNLSKVCNLKPHELDDQDSVARVAKCFFEKSKKLFTKAALKNKNDEIILWNGNHVVDKYNEFVNKLIKNTKNYEELLKIILGKHVIDSYNLTTLEQIFSDLKSLPSTQENFTTYEYGKKRRSRILIKRKFKSSNRK